MFSYQNSACLLRIPQLNYIPRPSQTPWLHYPNTTRWAVLIMKFLTMHCARFPNIFI